MFLLGKPFKTIRIFVGKARSLPKSVSSEKDFTWVGSGLSNKHLTRLEKLARSKHSSLVRKFITYGRKKFTTLAPGVNRINIFFSLLMF